MTPLRSDLVALARKYRTLAELRRAAHRCTALDARPALRALSAEFPGALRELDRLPIEDIEARIEAVDAAAHAGAPAQWMEWMLAYHEAMRAALFVKRRLAGRRRVAAGQAWELAGATFQALGFRCELAFVGAVAAPPGGRLNGVVFRHVAGSFRVPPHVLQQTLFPDRAAHAR